MVGHLFRVVDAHTDVSKFKRPGFYLERDHWDDYSYKISFVLWVIDQNKKLHDLGSVKIANTGYERGHGTVKLPQTFDELDDTHFSLGQQDGYYEELAILPEASRDLILRGLRDVVFDPDRFTRVRDLPVSKQALMRSVSPTTVRGKFTRLLNGESPLTNYSLEYSDPGSVNLSFDVQADSRPPSNIHVLIGRNGVGKTRLLSRMAQSIMSPNRDPEMGSFRNKDDFGNDSDEGFAGLALVTFSAFDTYNPPQTWRDARQPRFSYIGLKRWGGGDEATDGVVPLMGSDQLQLAFTESVRMILKDKQELWIRALEHLESDPVFEAIDVASIASEGLEKKAAALFAGLSSGHKIVLLTVTKLVEEVEEQTLVLIDEPEAHLHPPLLSALIRSLSDLLIKRNGVAIVATHSPVVLQEVPHECVWVLRRNGTLTVAERPQIETFGENVGTLTHEVFGLEVTSSGFYKLLADAADATGDYKAALQNFDRMVGGEGRAILRAMVAELDK